MPHGVVMQGESLGEVQSDAIGLKDLDLPVV